MFGFFGGIPIGDPTLINPQVVVQTTFDPTGKTVICSWGVTGNVAGYQMEIEIALTTGGPYFSPGIFPFAPDLGSVQIDLSAYIGLFESAQDYNFRFRLRDGIGTEAVNSPTVRFPPYSTV